MRVLNSHIFLKTGWNAILQESYSFMVRAYETCSDAFHDGSFWRCIKNAAMRCGRSNRSASISKWYFCIGLASLHIKTKYQRLHWIVLCVLASFSYTTACVRRRQMRLNLFMQQYVQYFGAFAMVYFRMHSYIFGLVLLCPVFNCDMQWVWNEYELQVSTLKSVVQDMTGLPCSKQKLVFDVSLSFILVNLFRKVPLLQFNKCVYLTLIGCGHCVLSRLRLLMQRV